MELEEAIASEPNAELVESLPAEYREALDNLPESLSSETPAKDDAGRSSQSARETDAASASSSGDTGDDRPAPSSWEPDEATRNAAQAAGLTDEELRSFGSADTFTLWREHTERLMSGRAASQPSQQASSAATSTANSSSAGPSEPEDDLRKQIKGKLDDEYLDPAEKALWKSLNDRLTEQDAALAEVRQQEHDRLAQQYTRQFDQAADKLGFENLGKGDKLTEPQRAAREKVYQALYGLAGAGLVREINEDAVKRAYSVAYPQDFERHLERTVVARARSQSQARAGDGRFSKPTEKPFDGPVEKDPALHDAYNELVLGR